MDENRPDDPTLAPDSSRPKRSPPTIDLEASDVTGPAPDASDAEAKNEAKDSPRPPLASTSVAQLLAAAVTGAVTAALVIAMAWAIGWLGETTPSRADIQTNASAIETLGSRLSELETRVAAQPAAPANPVQPAQLEALEKSVAALRTEAANARAQSEKLAAELSALKSQPAQPAAPADAADLAAIETRLSQIERATRAESDRIAQAANRPADDTALRRVVVASMLDISVRQSEPFTAALSAAKALAPDPNELKPLEDFAASGVPSPASLARELLTLVPKLTPPSPGNAAAGTGIVDRLQAGAAKLVRIERSDVSGNDRSAIVARVTAAALRNDVVDARRELNSLAPADRAAAQGWLDKADERDAALAAARHFAAEAMTALAKPMP